MLEVGQIKSSSKHFAASDCTSGYHQIGIDDSNSNLLVKATPSGRYKMSVEDQGGTFASDIFNLLTDDTTRMDDSVVKNMDDLMFYADSLSDLEKKIEEFLVFCREKT